MSSPRVRRMPVIATLVVLLVGVAFGHAQAQGSDTIAGGTIEFDFRLPDGDDGYEETSNEDTLHDFFNLAHCMCDEPDFQIGFQLIGATGTLPTRPVEIWVGQSCDDNTTSTTPRDEKCMELDGFGDVETLRSLQKRNVAVASFMFDTNTEPNAACEEEEGVRHIFAWVDNEDTTDNTYEAVFSKERGFDTLPPPLPLNPTLSSGERAIIVNWESPTERDDDVQNYQILCARVDGSINPEDGVDGGNPDGFPRDGALYETSSMLCSNDNSPRLIDPPSTDGPDAGVPEPDAAIFDAGIDATAFDASLFDATTFDATTFDATTFDADPTAIDAGPMDAAPPGDAEPDPFPDPITSPIHGLDKGFICGTVSKSEKRARIGGLENDVEYHVGLVVVDDAKNVAGYYLGTETPREVTDFWEEYHDQGGNADGGVCLVNSTYGGGHPFTTALRDFRDGTLAEFALGRALIELYYDGLAPLARLVEGNWAARIVVGVALAPFVAAAALWEYTGLLTKLLLIIGLLWLRRRRWQPSRPALLASATAAVLVAMVLTAAAQSPHTPYWERFDEPVDAYLGPEHLEWNFEFKLGPYLPDIDNEFSLGEGEVGPFENTFGGGSAIMGIIELQRFFMWPAGQLGVGVSVGVMGKTAKAFLAIPEPNGNDRSADDTSFRLIPTAVNAVYRFTELDDRWGVPLIPYGKLGLSYYLWYVTDPDGSFAKVPVDEENCPDVHDGCDSDRALGASFGWQATIGLSIRAERIDKQAAMNLRNEMNIEHAGFFAELLYARVNHFGADDRLKVGDFTWFGGISFEF